jgi:hypothetical protein
MIFNALLHSYTQFGDVDRLLEKTIVLAGMQNGLLFEKLILRFAIMFLLLGMTFFLTSYFLHAAIDFYVCIWSTSNM